MGEELVVQPERAQRSVGLDDVAADERRRRGRVLERGCVEVHVLKRRRLLPVLASRPMVRARPPVHAGAMSWIVGCDTGGTFTDLVALSDAGDFRVAKVPSTPPHFDRAVVEGVRQLGIPPADIRRLFHGTTVTTNAVITKRGAACALITTQGFRDILEIRRANREELYDITWDPPPALIPRRHRLEVDERVDYAGNVVRPLDEDTVRRCAEMIVARGLESVAVCLINAHMNPAHERRVREVLLEAAPDLSVSLSTDILPEPPEFERTATTVANAYTAPILSRYMSRLEHSLGEDGFGQDIVLVMHNGGGTMTSDYAKGHAVKTLNSGPAAGVIAGAAIAEAAGIANAVCIDMGGTTCEFAVVVDGRPRMSTSFDLEWGMPIRFPSIDVMSIGAGGGSIGWLDQAGKPRNGPQSAGADPGPACYGQGGREPTNTDAHLVLGRVSNDEFLDGRMALDRDLAVDAVRDGLAEPLGLDVEDAAEGLLRIANANMVAAITLVTVDRGYDPRDFTLIAFGGAGPLHAVDIAAELEMPQVVVPAYPGVTSALGLLFVDPLDDFSWAYVRRADELDVREMAGIYEDIGERVLSSLEMQGIERAQLSLERSLDLRYLGQLHSITVPLDVVDEEGLARAVTLFHDEHSQLYRYSHPDQPVEVSTLRVTARGARARPDLGAVRYRADGEVRDETVRQVHFADTGWVEARIVDRAALTPGDEVTGPTVVEGIDTTVVVPPDVTARVNASGDIVISLREERGA
jgi:N-methylhydantoinase A